MSVSLSIDSETETKEETSETDGEEQKTIENSEQNGSIPEIITIGYLDFFCRLVS